MKDEVGLLIDKSRRAAAAARRLLADGTSVFPPGRAYYAMFYAAEALLLQEGQQFRKHSGVQAAFGQHFARTGLLAPELHRWLLEAFSKRLNGDYGVSIELTTEEVEETIGKAERFLDAAKEYLRNRT